MKKYMTKRLRIFTASCIVYCIICIGLFGIVRSNNTMLDFIMGWNLFLACIPLALSVFFKYGIHNKKKILATVMFILWFFFFPNSVYMITDLIHLTNFKYMGQQGFIKTFEGWFWLIFTSVGIVLGTISGMRSLHNVAQIFNEAKGKIFTNICVIILSIIASYGVYIGRFLRFNSWDIINPITLIKTLVSDFEWFTVGFTLIFAIWVLFTYYVFKMLYQNCKNQQHISTD